MAKFPIGVNACHFVVQGRVGLVHYVVNVLLCLRAIDMFPFFVFVGECAVFYVMRFHDMRYQVCLFEYAIRVQQVLARA